MNKRILIKLFFACCVMVLFSLNTTILAQTSSMMNGGCNIDMEEMLSLLMEDPAALEVSQQEVKQYIDNGYKMYSAHFLDEEPFWEQGTMGQ